MGWKVPWWVSAILSVIPLLPVPPWIKLVDAVLQVLIRQLPQSMQAPARANLDAAHSEVARTGSSKPIKIWAKSQSAALKSR